MVESKKGFTKKQINNIIELIRNNDKNLKEKNSDHISIFDKMGKSNTKNPILVEEALSLSEYKNYSDIQAAKGTVILGVVLYDIVFKHLEYIKL